MQEIIELYGQTILKAIIFIGLAAILLLVLTTGNGGILKGLYENVIKNMFTNLDSSITTTPIIF